MKKHFLLAMSAITTMVIIAWVPMKITPRIVDDEKLITIPVIFHVFYVDSSADNGINETSRNNGNSSQYITQEKVKAELADLDRDFQMKNEDVNTANTAFKGVAGNAHVHFTLQNILYIRLKSWGSRFESSNTGYLHSISPVVSPEKTLNVYIGKIKYDWGGTDGVTPVRINATTDQRDDAVNLSYLWVGLGWRLLSHETGHWLGLWHTWDERQYIDGVTDIPVQVTYTDGNCYSCPPDVREQKSNDPNFHHTNFNNFMDYSGCRVMFSIDQVKRMRLVIQDYRSEIWNTVPH